MSARNIDSGLVAEVSKVVFRPAVLAMLTFRSETSYAWSGIGSLVWDGNTYLGMGSFADIGSIAEGTDVQAAGTTLSLSGIDSNLLAECMTDIQLGAAAKVWFAAVGSDGSVIAPYLAFSGCVDKSMIDYGPETSTISLSLESRLTDLQRASMKRYTMADQHILYPDDTGLKWVEILNDISLKWGQA